jgi:uncharacterized coiled-coil protein SlyX
LIGEVRNSWGPVAEEVAVVNPDLVISDKEGKPYSVRYDQVNAMLLNEFLNEHRAFIEEQRKMAEQQKEIDALKTELREQRFLIQKVSDKMKLSESVTKVATHNPQDFNVSVPHVSDCAETVHASSLTIETRHLAIVSTAVPPSLPARNRSSAVLASSKGNVCVSVRTGTRGAISKNSSPSRRVRFATEVMTRSSQRSA